MACDVRSLETPGGGPAHIRTVRPHHHDKRIMHVCKDRGSGGTLVDIDMRLALLIQQSRQGFFVADLFRICGKLLRLRRKGKSSGSPRALLWRSDLYQIGSQTTMIITKESLIFA